MKLLWRGTLSYGLAIPIELYKTPKNSFICKLIHSKCFFEIKEGQWCNHCNSRIKTDEIIKQISSGKYKDNIKNDINIINSPNTINILELIEANGINFEEKQYSIIPAYVDSNYFLFLNLMESLNKVALGKILLENKEYFCIIKRIKNLLYLNTLNESNLRETH